MNMVVATALQLPRSQSDRGVSWRDMSTSGKSWDLRMGQAKWSEMGDWEKKSFESKWSRNLSLMSLGSQKWHMFLHQRPGNYRKLCRDTGILLLLFLQYQSSLQISFFVCLFSQVKVVISKIWIKIGNFWSKNYSTFNFFNFSEKEP